MGKHVKFSMKTPWDSVRNTLWNFHGSPWNSLDFHGISVEYSTRNHTQTPRKLLDYRIDIETVHRGFDTSAHHRDECRRGWGNSDAAAAAGFVAAVAGALRGSALSDRTFVHTLRPLQLNRRRRTGNGLRPKMTSSSSWSGSRLVPPEARRS